MKKRVSERGVFLLVSIIASIYVGMLLGVNLDGLLTRRGVTIAPLGMFQILAAHSQAKKLSVLFVLLCVLIVLYWFFSKPELFKSKEAEIIPGLFIPQRENAGQYGRSWFIEKRDFSKHFGVAHIPYKMYEPYVNKETVHLPEKRDSLMGRLKSKLKCRLGATMLLETPAMLVVWVFCIAFAINLFGALHLSSILQMTANECCRAAELTGYESAAWKELDRINAEMGFDCEMDINVKTIDGDKIQQGTKIEVIITDEFEIQLGGLLDIELSLSRKAVGHGERWWK